MFPIKCSRIVFYLVLCVLNAYGEIDEDYFYGYRMSRPLLPLRSNIEVNRHCTSRLQDFLCKLRCSKDHFCVNNHCICIDIVSGNKTSTNKPHTIRQRAKLDKYDPSDYVDLTKLTEKEEYVQKPIMRHHIAHFCPNLEDARTCIRKCMQVGKPAFCGKDHVCYCGHKYHEGIKDKEVDAKTIYAQFKDLYKKYFGEGYSPNNGGSGEDH